MQTNSEHRLIRRYPLPAAKLTYAALAATLVLGGCATRAPGTASVPAEATRADLEIVECLLPGKVMQLGNSAYLSQRRPTRTTQSDCRIRGGEYVAYDRADYKSALRIWMASAEGGDAEAQVNVGEIYERGLGDAPNYEAAAIWYRKAADQGNTRGLFNLGTFYEQGLGVEQDKLQALNLYRQAWGLPADNLVYERAAQDEIERQRAELQQQIANKNEQIEALSRQVKELRDKLSKSSGAASAAQRELEQQADTLARLVASLQTERSRDSGRLASLPVLTRQPGTAKPDASAPPDPKVFERYVRGLNFGRYFAIIIGNQNYQQLEDLQTPHSDAERAGKLLQEKYGFTVQVLEDASDVAMLRALNDLGKVLQENDNLLIYYAGHGSRLDTARTETGYWLPVNAEQPPNDTFWVPNEQISAHLGRLKAKRVLVVADSCYAGLLSSDPGVNVFGTDTQSSLDYLKYKLPKRSRLLLSSGGDQPVLDSGGGANSVFARAFIDVLEANTDVLSTPALFARLQKQVRISAARSRFEQEPEFKSIKSAGHEVGDFFFVPATPAT